MFAWPSRSIAAKWALRLPRDPAGTIINDPSGDELPPNIPEETLLAQEPFTALDPKWDTAPNPNAPKRTAPASSRVAPDPKAHRADSSRRNFPPVESWPVGSSASKAGQEFSSRRTMTSPASRFVAVTTEQVQMAEPEPNSGWPSYSALFPNGNPTEVVIDPVFNPKRFRKKAANDGHWILLPLPLMPILAKSVHLAKMQVFCAQSWVADCRSGSC